MTVYDETSASWLDKKLANLTLGWFLTALSIILLLVAWNRGIALLYGLVALIIATLIVAWITPRLMLLGVSVHRSTPETAIEDSTVNLEVSLASSGRFSRYLIEIWDCLPFTAQNNQQLISFVPVLTKQQSVLLPMNCELRGLHELGPIKLKTGFPLGIHRREVEIQNTQANILVYPKPLNVQRFDPGTCHTNNIDDAQVQQHRKGLDEFAGVREYCHGDSIRHIHWHASARRKEMIVREFHPVTTMQMSVLLELQSGSNIGAGKHSTLEYAVKIAASLGQYALTEGIPFNLSGSSSHKLSTQHYKHPLQLKNLLKTLALVQAGGDIPYPELIHQFIAENNRVGTVILFDNGQNDLKAGLNMLTAKRYQPIIYRFDVPTFEKQRFHTAFVHTRERGIPVYTIQCGSDLARLFQ